MAVVSSFRLACNGLAVCFCCRFRSTVFVKPAGSLKRATTVDFNKVSAIKYTAYYVAYFFHYQYHNLSIFFKVSKFTVQYTVKATIPVRETKNKSLIPKFSSQNTNPKVNPEIIQSNAVN